MKTNTPLNKRKSHKTWALSNQNTGVPTKSQRAQSIKDKCQVAKKRESSPIVKYHNNSSQFTLGPWSIMNNTPGNPKNVLDITPIEYYKTTQGVRKVTSL